MRGTNDPDATCVTWKYLYNKIEVQHKLMIGLHIWINFKLKIQMENDKLLFNVSDSTVKNIYKKLEKIDNVDL